MASEVVQFREQKEVLDALRRRRIKPNAFAREAFGAALRELEALETFRRLDRSGIRLLRSPATIIRRERRSH